MNMPKKVTICEVGPRDGFQSEKTIIPTGVKVDIINRVVASGIRVIEVGSFVNPKAIPQMADSDEVVRQIKKVPGVQYRSFITNLRGVERALACGLDRIKLSHSSSESHNLSNLNQSIAESVKGFGACVELSRKHNVILSAALAVAFGCPFEGKVPVETLKAHVRRFLDFGIYEILLADTTGMANPQQVYNIMVDLVETFPEVKWILHMHDTRGMALANILAAMQAGVSCFDASFSGLGGCPYAPGASGNVATEDLVHMLHEMGIETGIDLDQAIENAKLARTIVGHATDSRMLKAGKVADVVLERPLGQNKIG